MLLTDARRPARLDAAGELVLLEDQDRSRWDRGAIVEGQALVERAARVRQPGPYQLQAAIAAVHDAAPTADRTAWSEIIGLYDSLLGYSPTPIVELNRAAAVAMRDGPAAGLAIMDRLAADGALEAYPYLHAGRGELLCRLDRRDEAQTAYQRAAGLTTNATERAFLDRRLRDLAQGH
jgi:RNA polymerase sigma-70 factor (ECF subfamily)